MLSVAYDRDIYTLLNSNKLAPTIVAKTKQNHATILHQVTKNVLFVLALTQTCILLFHYFFPLDVFCETDLGSLWGWPGTLPQSGQKRFLSAASPKDVSTRLNYHSTTSPTKDWLCRAFVRLFSSCPILLFVNSSWDNPVAGPYKRIGAL